MMNHWKRWRNFLLVWLGSSLLCIAYAFLVDALNGTPNWLDVLVFAGWAALASRWLGLIAERLQRRRAVRWVAIVVTSMALLVIALPWALHLPVSGGLLRISDAGQYFLSLADLTPRSLLLTIPQTLYILQYLTLALGRDYLQGTATITEHFQVAGLPLVLGLGLTALALSWCVTWQALLSTPAIVNLWARLYNPVQRVWTGARRARAWYWLRRGLAWGLVLLLALDTIGVLLTARPVAVEWEPILTTGFPSALPLSVQALVVGSDGDSLFAGTSEGGVYRSEDGGQSWQPSNNGLTNWDVQVLVIGPDRKDIFAGTNGGGIFHSEDNGQSWQSINEELMSMNVHALVVGPDGESLFAGTGDGKVFRSDDDGQSWQLVSRELNNDASIDRQSMEEQPVLSVQSLIVGPDRKSLFAGTDSGGVFRSGDDGQSWQSVNEDLTTLDVQVLTVGPKGEILFAGTEGGGVFCSDDGGRSWRPVNAGLASLYVRTLAVGPDESLYAGTSGGVFRSADDGQSWQAVNQGLTSLSVRALMVGPDERLYAGTGEGVFRSADNGESWQAVNQGLTSLDVSALTVGPDGKSIFASTYGGMFRSGGGVFRSDDGGQSWQAVNQGLTSLDVDALVVGPDGKSLFASTYGGMFRSGGGVFRSDDGGQSWQAVNQGLTSLDVRALMVGPDGKSIFASTYGGVFRSDDDGQSWQAVNQGLTSLDVSALTVGPDGKSLFVGISGGGVFRSDNGGQSWRPVNEGLTTSDVQTLAMGSDGETLFAGTDGDGIFRSGDNGQSWRPVNEGLTSLDVQALAAGPGGESLFAGTRYGGVFRFDDSDRTWRSVNGGLTFLDVRALMVGPDGKSLFAGTRYGGVFRSNDDGRSWQPINQGMTDLDVSALVVGMHEGTLFAVIANGGVFYSNDDGQSWRPINYGLGDLNVQELVVQQDRVNLFARTYRGAFRFDGSDQTWHSITRNLVGQAVWALTVGPDGENFFAGSSQGVLRFDNGGQTLQPLNRGLTSLNVRALVVGPDGESFFAGIWGGGVFHSDDSGQSWQSVNKGLTSLDVQTLAVGPDGRSLFAGTDDGGIFRSDNKGQTWRPVNYGLTSLDVNALMVGPDGKSLFASTYGTYGGVFRSDDRGQTWRPVNQGLTSQYVLTLALGPDGKKFFTGTDGGGIFRSDDGGETWQAVNEGLTDLNIVSLATGPDDESIFAGTFRGGVFRSDDEGLSWQPVNQGLTDLSVWALALGPDGRDLFAGTWGGGVFRSDNNGQSWRAITEGLLSTYVQSLVVGPDGKRLFASATSRILRSDDGGQTWQISLFKSVQTLMVGPDGTNLFATTYGEDEIFHSDDNGQTWQSVSGSDIFDLPTSVSFDHVRMKVDLGTISLTKPEIGWLRWAAYRYQDPLAIAIHENHAILYAPAGAAMMLRAEVPLPLLWRAPTPYLTMVMATWRGIYWAGANVIPISIGLGLAMVMVLLYVGVARPNQLGFPTFFWLLPRPRHILAASAYRSYTERWAEGDHLERLALLQAPTDAPFTSASLEATLRQLGDVFDADGLQAALSALLQRGLLVQKDDTWRLAEPLLAQVQRRELPRDQAVRLAEQIRAQHPLYARTRNFIAQARFRMQELAPEEFLLAPQGQTHPQAGYGPVYARLIAGRPPTGDDFTAVCEATHQHYGDDLSHRVALVISDRRPEPGARYRLYEIRQREGLAIVSLDVYLFGQIKPNRTANDILAAEIDQATGQQNLYALSGPVSGDLSFFGRERVLQEIIDLLDAGQPVGLFGLRKVGKTSLIQRLQGRLDQRRTIALVDTQTIARQQGVWPLYPAIVAGFVAHLERTRPDLALPDLRLYPEAGSLSPAIAESFLQDLRALHAALGQPEARERLLLIVDEVDRLFPSGEMSGYEGFAALFGQLRAANQQARLLDFVVVGVNPALNRRERWQDTDNELYRALREVWVPSMSPQDVQEMIESLGAQMGVRYEPGALRLLAQAGGGQPFVTRQICSLAVEGRLGREVVTITMDQAQAAIEEFVFRDPYLPELWRTRLDDTQREMLCALAQAAEPIPHTHLLPPAQRQASLVALGALEERTLARRDEGGCTIAWDVFRDWIRWVELGLEE